LNADGALADNWNGEVAIFRKLPGQFSGGVVTVEGAQAFTGIQFVDEGYRLTGTGSLVTDAEGFEIRVLANSARIDTAISGTGLSTRPKVAPSIWRVTTPPRAGPRSRAVSFRYRATPIWVRPEQAFR